MVPEIKPMFLNKYNANSNYIDNQTAATTLLLLLLLLLLLFVYCSSGTVLLYFPFSCDLTQINYAAYGTTIFKQLSGMVCCMAIMLVYLSK
jgi:hypothetical protein